MGTLKKSTKKAYKKYKKQPRSQKERAVVGRIKGQIVPDKMLVTMPYAGISNYTLSSTVDLQFQNSGYDPLASAGGHQPLSFDEWYKFYKKYRVIALTGTVSIINLGTSPLVMYQWGSADGLVVGTPGIFENPSNGKPKLIGSANGGHDIVTTKMSVYFPSILGLTRSQYLSDDTTQGLLGNMGIGSDPVKKAFSTIYVQTVDASNLNITFLFDLQYHFELTDCQTLASS